MSLDLLFQEELEKQVGAVLQNGRLARGASSTLSPFFVSFLAYPKLGMSPFTGLNDQQQQEGLLYGTAEPLTVEYDNDASYSNVLLSVAEAVVDACPYSLMGQYGPFCGRGSWYQNKYLVLALLPIVSDRYRDLVVGHVESELQGQRVTALQYLEYARRYFYLKAILTAFFAEDVERAGALCGLLSPTTNIGEWKRVVIQRVLHGE